MPYVIRQIIDELIAGTLTNTLLARHVGLFLLFAIISIIFSRWMRKLPLKTAHTIEYALRRDLFNHLTTLDQAFYRSERTGDLMTRMSSDITIVRDAIGQGLLQGTRTVVVIVFAAVVMTLTDPQLTLISTAVFIPMIALFFGVLHIMRRYQEALQAHVSEVSNFCQESFAGIRCLKGFAMERRRNADFKHLNADLLRKTMRSQAARQVLWPSMAFWFSLGTILIFIVGGRKIIAGRSTVGTLTQFSQYLIYMQWPLLALSWVLSMLQRGKVSWIRIRQLLEREATISDTNHALLQPPPSATIDFRDVSLSIGGRTFLHHLNLHVDAGKTLGITGPTGSGKTLFASLVARLMDPSEGSISIGGIDLRDLPLAQLRGMIGFAAQEPVLFSRTLEQNIGFGVETPDSDLVGWAAETAHLHHDIESFPEKYNTLLGERGVTLSGGQRQRACISRALARKPDILILDDVLSAVDTQTEAAIMQKLRPVMAKRTTLFVSHRVSTLRYADEIIVIENGAITQRGTHAELVQHPGYYAELDTMQQIENRLEETP